MAVDTPAHIVIVGLNALALEAGLYARFLGYQVSIFDSGFVCDSVQKQPEIAVDGKSTTSLGCKAISAQNESFDADSIEDAILTNQDWWEKYLKPLSESDLLIDSIFANQSIASVRIVEEELEDESDGGNGDEEDEDEVCATVFEISLKDTTSTTSANVGDQPVVADVLIDLQFNGSVHFDFVTSLGVDVSKIENDVTTLFTSIDDFYVLGDRKTGAKYGHADGLEQVCQLFKIIGDRESLDLYA